MVEIAPPLCVTYVHEFCFFSISPFMLVHVTIHKCRVIALLPLNPVLTDAWTILTHKLITLKPGKCYDSHFIPRIYKSDVI